jgi:hypothetical protein
VQRKTQGNWVVEIGWRLPRKEVAGDICLRRPRPNQDCRADDEDADDDDADIIVAGRGRRKETGL